MNLDTLTGAAAILLVFPLLMLALVVVIAPDGVRLDELFGLPTAPRWPQGVQEEEPVPWRLERLTPRGAAPVAEVQKPRREPVANERPVTHAST
jgi:hypothetical protein